MLTKLTLKNFKSFEHAEIKLGPVTTLIGTNASGKSNVRDALRILHGIARGYTLAEIIGEKWEQGIPLWKGIRGGTREMIFHGSQERYCEIGVEFRIKVDNPFHEQSEWFCGEYKIAIDLDNQGHPKPKLRSESLIIEGKGEFVYKTSPPTKAKEKMIEVLIRTSDKPLSVEVLEYRNDTPIINRIDFDLMIFGGHEAMRYVDELVSLLSKMRFLDVTPDAMRQSSLPGQTILSDRGENLSSVLHAICEEEERKQILLEWMAELTPQDVQDFVFTEDQQGKVLLNLKESDSRLTSAYSASDGTLRFLAMIAALLSPEPARFYFFEEVENGIHPSRLHLLVQLMEQRSIEDDGQLMVSTHSPQLLAYLSEQSREFASLIYRPTSSKSSHAIPIPQVPHINEALQTQDVSEIHASGWFENVMEFMEDGEEGQDA